MASKWLEERWERLLPVLALLGQEQEEQIKRLCEEELQAWRERPSLKEAKSLSKPLTQTRNRIRETFQVTDSNSWINPQSGVKEHLSLKYLNFSSQVWTQMNLPSDEQLQQRQAYPLSLRNPSAVLSKVEQLLQMKSWPELVVGLGLATGRGQVEVLHTGQFISRSAYLVHFAGPMTVYERMCDPFEVPTLVRADLVMEALQRLRAFFKNHFAGMSRRDMSRQCSEDVQDAIYRQVLGVIPLRSGERKSYLQLAHGVYPRLATFYYCPSVVDEITYMATIQNHRKILETTDEKEQFTLALAAGYRDYVIVDPSGEIEKRRGIRLGEPEVELLDIFRQHEEKKKHHFAEEERDTLLQEKPDQQVLREGEGEMDEGGRDEEGQSILSDQERREKPQERPQQKYLSDSMGASEHHCPLSENEERERVLDFVLQEENEKQGQVLTETQWLERRWALLLREIADFTVDDEEEEICAICEWEMEIWRRYCKKAKTMTFQEMVMGTRCF